MDMTVTRASARIELVRLLECAVVLSWEDLMPAAPSGLIHIEFRTGPSRSLEYLKIWSCRTRGYWDLVCHTG